jgi:hypothetical protein
MDTSGGVGKNPYKVRPESKIEVAAVGKGVEGVCDPQASTAITNIKRGINMRFIF